MATVTIKTTPLLLKNGKTFILEENEYEFCPEIWDLIKEFAGIYNFAINWKTKFTSHPYTIRRHLRFTYSYPQDNKLITDTLFKKLPEGDIRRLFWKKVNSGDFKTNIAEINYYGGRDVVSNKKQFLHYLNNCFGLFKLSKEFNVGDEVTFLRGDFAGDRAYRAGKIHYISKDRKFYRFAEYHRIVIRNIPTNDRDTQCEMGWDTSLITYSFTIKSDKGLKKGLHNYILTHFYN